MSDTNSKDSKHDVAAEKDKPQAAKTEHARAESEESLSSVGKQIKEHRQKQHETGKSGATNQFGLNSAKDILGDHAHGASAARTDNSGKFYADANSKHEQAADKLHADANSKHEQVAGKLHADANSKHEQAEKLKEVAHTNSVQEAKYEKATAELLDTARQRFGKENIDAMHIKKDDMSTAVSALLLGPDVCKAMGPDEAAKFGKRLIVFGVAPAFGMTDEAQKQFSKQNLASTAHDAGFNFLSGTAIGAILEHAHPLITGAAMLGGGAMFVNDQMNSPEHKERNAKVAHIASKVDNANNDDIADYAKQTRKLIGPDAYKGVFTVVTGGAGVGEGQAVKAGARTAEGQIVKTAIKDEAGHAAGKIDLKLLAENIQKSGREIFKAVSDAISDHLPAKKDVVTDAQTGTKEVVHDAHVGTKDGATEMAKNIRATAEKAEAGVTKTLSDLAAGVGGKMEGLEHNLKSIDSMARKIRDEGPESINDALRYTTLLVTEKLGSGANQIMEQLEKSGYEKLAVKNTFEAGSKYVGINTTFVKDGQVFELQFHTPESLSVKEALNHPLYEIRRELFTKCASGEGVEFKQPSEILAALNKDENIKALARCPHHVQEMAIKIVDAIANHKDIDLQQFANALSRQMAENNRTIPIPKDADMVKSFRKEG